MSRTTSSSLVTLLLFFVLTAGMLTLFFRLQGFLASLQPKLNPVDSSLFPRRTTHQDSEPSGPRRLKSSGPLIPAETPDETNPEDELSTFTLSDADFTSVTLTDPGIELPPPGKISGRITNLESEPVEGAQITVSYEFMTDEEAMGLGPKATAVSASDGTYLLESVWPGDCIVVASHEQYAATHRLHVEVRPEKETKGVDLILSPGSVIQGQVKDVGGQGLPWAKIEVRRRFLFVNARDGQLHVSNYIYRTISSGTEGRFTLEHIAAGENLFHTELQGYAPDDQSLEVSQDRDPAPLEIILKPGGVIGGRVIGPTRLPISGAKVIAFVAQSSLSTTGEKSTDAPSKDAVARPPLTEALSDATGGFLLKNLQDNQTYDIQVIAQGLSTGWLLDVKVNTLHNLIVLGAGGAVSGKVVLLGNKTPVGGVTLGARPIDGLTGIAMESKSEPDGRYEINGLPGGNYEVTVDSGRWVAEARRPVEVKPGQTTPGQDFVIYEGIRVNGTVVDAQTGARIGLAEVNARGMTGGDVSPLQSAKAFANEAGEFTFPCLAAGIYQLTASASGYVTPTKDKDKLRIELAPGTPPSTVELALRRGGQVTGKVTGVGPVLLGRAEVMVYQTSGMHPTLNRNRLRSSCNADGYFKIQGIPLEETVSFYVLASADGQAVGRSSLLTLSSMRPHVDILIPLSEGRDVFGKVMDINGRAIEGVEVKAEPEICGDALKVEAWKDRSTPDGGFRLSHVPIGTILIKAKAEYFQPYSKTYDVTDQEQTEPLIILMKRGGSISGLVVDDLGIPLEGAKVTCSNSAYGSYRTAEVLSDASYELNGVIPGANSVDVSSRRKTSVGELNYTLTRSNVKPDATRCDFVFPINARLTGKVVESKTTRPMKQFHIDLTVTVDEGMGASGVFSLSVPITSETGSFSLDYLAGGSAALRISADDHLPWDSKELTLTSPGVVSVGVVHLEPAGQVGVQVYSSRTGEPISGATATWLPDGPSGGTDSRGHVVVRNIPCGVGRLRIEHSHYLKQETGLIEALSGREPMEATVELDPGAMLTGTVTDGQGNPISGAEITLSLPQEEDRKTSTDSSGRYQMDGLPPGGGSIQVEKTLNQGASQAVRPVVLRADIQTIEDFILDASCSVKGSLVAPPGIWPDPGKGRVQAILLGPNGRTSGLKPISASVDNEGDFLIENLVPGMYVLLGEWPLYSADRPNVPTPLRTWGMANLRDPITRRDLYLYSSMIQGQAFSRPNGPPLSKINLTVALTDSPMTGDPKRKPWWQWTVSTNATGNFILGGLGPGTYSLVDTKKPPRFTPQTISVALGSDEYVVELVGTASIATPTPSAPVPKSTPKSPARTSNTTIK